MLTAHTKQLQVSSGNDKINLFFVPHNIYDNKGVNWHSPINVFFFFYLSIMTSGILVVTSELMFITSIPLNVHQ